MLRRPLHEVLTWPSWSVDAMLYFISVEPMPEVRQEILMACMCTMYGESHKAKGSTSLTVDHYLPWRNAWNDDAGHDAGQSSRYTAEEREMLRNLK